jgi:hypothetical protein
MVSSGLLRRVATRRNNPEDTILHGLMCLQVMFLWEVIQLYSLVNTAVKIIRLLLCCDI